MSGKISIAVMVGGLGFLLAPAQIEPYHSWESRFAPPEWQTLLCFPEDHAKTLVDHQGTLLYDHGQGGGEFATRVTLSVAPAGVWVAQSVLTPRTPIVRTCWRSADLEITQEAFALRGQALGEGYSDSVSATQRLDGIILDVRNLSDTTITLYPTGTVFSVYAVTNEQNHLCLKEGQRRVTFSRPFDGSLTRKRGYYRVPLAPLAVPAGEVASVALLYGEGVGPEPEISVAALRAARERMVAFWQAAPLPYDHIKVPEPKIQALLDSSLRNIWQVREAQDGVVQFQPGPTCYRGLWIVDGAFMAELATMLGRVMDARATLCKMLAHQQAHGGICLVRNYFKENGIVLWAFCQHARLTGDRQWLRQYWPRLQRVAAYIQTLRQQTLHNEEPLDDGLIPPGFPDGGQWQVVPEYSNVFWNLLGLKMFYETAAWLGEEEAAREWQAEYTDFRQALERAAARDLRRDQQGHPYLANFMGAAATNDLPQRGLWSFCKAIYPGQLFASDDPIARGTLEMLQATEQQGMVVGTGWHESGIWSYFASFYAHAWLWLGAGDKAGTLLRAFAEHAAPTLVWCEEHSLVGEKYKKIGDMPHAWSGSEFVRLVRNLLVLERGTELHLFEGLPQAWCAPGMQTQMQEIHTYFGKLTLCLEFATDDGTPLLTLAPLSDTTCTAVVVHTKGWADGADMPVRLAPRRAYEKYRLR